MTKNAGPRAPMIFANGDGLTEKLTKWVGTRFEGKPFVFLCISKNALSKHALPKDFTFVEMGADWSFTRALIVFEHIPIDLDAVGAWREWAMNHGVLDLRMAFLDKEATEDSIKNNLDANCKSWFEPIPEKENTKFTLGNYVSMPQRITVKDDPSLLTMMFGSMGELLAQVDVVARRFREAVNQGLEETKTKKYLAEIDALLAVKAKSGVTEPTGLGLDNLADHLPRLLLRGESGVGKTLLASYLHNKSGRKGRPLHISIPEYLGKEDSFEFSLFGYAKGNHTGGKPEGDHGLLLQHVGGVVFLDEIGEANAVLQAKLLTFLDNYKIRPRGWIGNSFYCRVLVVAATNRDLDQKVDGKPIFRKDLLARFTDRHPIPALRERMGDLPFILDCLLQRNSMNPDGFVKEIGREAFEFLKVQTFEEGNFRELEDLFRSACQRAIRDARRYLVKADFSRK